MTQIISKLVDLKPREGPLLAWAFVYFFCLLGSYYIIRPLRDALGISAGIENLQYLYLVTIAAMLALVPLFGWLTSKYPRQTFLPFIYGFFISNLLIFYALFRLYPEAELLASSFYLWVNVYNLFVVSVFWSFMGDLFTDEQAKRLFGFIAAGGSAGAIAGPLLTSLLIDIVGQQNLLLLSALFLGMAILCISRVVDADKNFERSLPDVQQRTENTEASIEGGAWDGISLVFRSPYLLGICVLMLSYSVLSTFLYFQQVEIIADNFADTNSRTVVFARVDLAVNVLTILTQLFITSRLIKWLGLGLTLALVPMVLAVGLIVLGLSPALGLSMLVVVIILQIIRRAGYYALINPARENLYVVVSRAEKYKAKNFIDTSVYRGGDALAAAVSSVLRGAGFTVANIALLAVPIALVWAGVSLWLGKKHDDLAKKH